MASSFPTLRALAGAWRRAREAAVSSTQVRHITGAHQYRIDNYSRLAGTPPSAAALPGHCIESARFAVGGHEWQLYFFPNGDEDPGSAAVKLVLTGRTTRWQRLLYRVPQHATAAYEVSVLDDGNRVLSRAFRPRRFSAWSYENAEVVATAAEMRAAATRGGKEEDGGIVVRCDVTVMELEEESASGGAFVS